MRSHRRIPAIICALGAVVAVTMSSGSAPVAGHAGGGGAKAATPAARRPWLPPTPPLSPRAAARPWLPPAPTYWPQVVGEQSTRPQTVTGGVQLHTKTYQTVGGAQKAQVMNIDLTNPDLHFGAVEAGDKMVDPDDETISSMAARTG